MSLFSPSLNYAGAMRGSGESGLWRRVTDAGDGDRGDLYFCRSRRKGPRLSRIVLVD
ncbi:hypothetical protein VFPPC_16034 [Pochonia chlamydosporia 170]|uniref:Uncharacterized protein n=1 Tax=Pochonia chlamydosporia 170 TaxID=1380566 RepID=A0A179FN87_METCM|nr:hypothetical protein VFPPC_16034 [Pochonia chlamydosporia 170]OAQ66479.1 hypothetical protein VFPPC_16034 [Pochonia chlamydosporia 170]